MPKLSLTKAAHLPTQYTEIDQPNKIRFSILYKEEDGSFTDQSGKFKCRDFFNDCVAARKGFFYKIYGWDNQLIKTNEEGIYLLLSELSLKNWDSNFALVNKEAEEQGFPNISVEKYEGERLLFIPNEYRENTYTLSYLTALIRWCNNDSTHESFNDFVYNFKDSDRDAPFSTYKAAIVEQGFKAPKNNWWWAGTISDKLGPKNYKDTGHERTMHNCGARTWLFSMNIGI